MVEFTPTTDDVRASSNVASTDDMVTVSYYEHSCEWLSKYCDEHHRRSALVPRAALVTK